VLPQRPALLDEQVTRPFEVVRARLQLPCRRTCRVLLKATVAGTHRGRRLKHCVAATLLEWSAEGVPGRKQMQHEAIIAPFVQAAVELAVHR